MHLGSKIKCVEAPLVTRTTSRWRTRRCRRVSEAIADDQGRSLTIKASRRRRLDGTAARAGDIGPEADVVMEGKAMLLKEFAGVDGWPICLATTDVGKIVAAVTAVPGLARSTGDISAPRCFEIEERPRASLDIPSSTTTNTALRSSSTPRSSTRFGSSATPRSQGRHHRVGAASIAMTRILQHAGVRNVVSCDRAGRLRADRVSPGSADYPRRPQPDCERGRRRC
jgi:malate dehydrogenase (oxaloacetate-decarboxylating)